jgi:transcriptional regulator with XRE-family HTH domain
MTNPLPDGLRPTVGHRTDRLQALMGAIGISTYAELCQRTGVTEKVIRRLRLGAIGQMQVRTLAKIAQGLQISAPELLAQFSEPGFEAAGLEDQGFNPAPPPERLEYDRLQQQLATQREALLEEFQQTTLQTIESWMLQWPTAAHAAQQNPTAPAVKLLPLVRPVENLLTQWGIVSIGVVGEPIAFDPQRHQVIGPVPDPGDPVRVRYVGYCQGDRLLHRAKVSAENADARRLPSSVTDREP